MPVVCRSGAINEVGLANRVASSRKWPGQRESDHEPRLAAVQRRRDRPTRRMQALQAAATGGLNRDLFRPPTALLRVVSNLGLARRLMGRTIGLGFRRERVLTPDVWGG